MIQDGFAVKMLGRHLLFEMHGRLGPSRRLRHLMYDPKSTTIFLM